MGEHVTLKELVISKLGGKNGDRDKDTVARAAEGQEEGWAAEERAGAKEERVARARGSKAGRKDVGHGGICLCRECEAKRRG